MKNTFERIGSKKFVGFGGWFKWKERTIGDSGLEKNKKNDQALPVDDK